MTDAEKTANALGVQLITPEHHAWLRKRIDAFDAYTRAHHMKRGGWIAYKPEELPVDVRELAVSNDERGQVEQFEYANRTHVGMVYFAYWTAPEAPMYADGSWIKTWSGHRLAVVTHAGPIYKTPAFGFPSKRRNFRALGIDGRHWSGVAYVSSGDYVRMCVVDSPDERRRKGAKRDRARRALKRAMGSAFDGLQGIYGRGAP